MIQLPREYKDTTSTWLPMVIGGIAGLMGIFALCFGIGAWLFGADLLTRLMPIGLGIFALCLGAGYPIHMHWNHTSETINCAPGGFSVTSENKRRGTRREEYRWEEVTGTNYEEVRHRNHGKTRVFNYFSVETPRGQAFKAGQYQGDFEELIAVFNERAPNLPYLWTRAEASLANNLMSMMTSIPTYSKVPRLPRTGPPPLPPPLPLTT